MKCKFYKYKNENGGITIAAVSKYDGKVIKGFAKCHPDDEFDEEKGRQLAEARCRIKYNKKRLNRATSRYMEAADTLNEAVKKFEKMKIFYMDCIDQMDEAILELKELTANCENLE